MSAKNTSHPKDASEVLAGLKSQKYLAGEGLGTAVFLALELQMPLFLEGEAGVGKTEAGKALAGWTGGELIRLQCYEGIDINQAVYEWNYSRQLLHIRMGSAEKGAEKEAKKEAELYSKEFLIARPLLKAISHDSDDSSGGGAPPVLLIDELDRADDEFEAFLLEILSDWSITIPELGTVQAQTPPVVVITSNRTRDVHDALKRRCLYHWISHPSLEQEVEIIMLRADPAVTESLAEQVASLVEQFRNMDLYKPPGVAESIVWANALQKLGAKEITRDLAVATMGAVLKYSEDQEKAAEIAFS